jgi:hypothetical protein
LSYLSNNATISMTICVEVRNFSQFCLLHEMLHNLGVRLLYFVSFFLNCHQLWILILFKRWMLTFLSIYIYFTLIMCLWLKFTLITKLFLFLFPYFSHEDMNFYISERYHRSNARTKYYNNIIQHNQTIIAIPIKANMVYHL